MTTRTYLVTGGTGFLGRGIVRRLVAEGFQVRVLDNDLRGKRERLADVADRIELIQADVRDAGAVRTACKGVDGVLHLAFLNGTRFFYEKPELVLDIGVKGMVNVIDGAIAEGVPDLIVASSSEVYQNPPSVPTDERVPLVIPDPMNPRYSYGAGKILYEMMTINYGRKHFERAIAFRPHNVYGPDMGWEHVIPQFALRMRRIVKEAPDGPVRFPIQGTGKETRAFIHIDDFTEGLYRVVEKGEHLNIYHVGTMDEVAIGDVAKEVGKYFNREVVLVPGETPKGSTPRRCPDISKLRSLGFEPRVPLSQGVRETARWYDENAHLEPSVSTTEGTLYEQR